MAEPTPYPQRLVQALQASRQRSAQTRLREAQGMEQSMNVLASVRKPHIPVYIFLGIIALMLDSFDFVETATAVTGLVFVLQLLLEIGFFLLLKAMIGRGLFTSWVMIAGVMLCLASSAISAPIFAPLLVLAAFTNRSAHIVEKNKETLIGQIESIDLQIARYSTRVERLAQTASRASLRLSRISQTAQRARIAGRVRLASRKITRTSRTISRALRNTIGNIIPVVELIPFQLWTVYATYRDQLRVWSEAQALIAEYQEKVGERKALEEEEAAITAALVGATIGEILPPQRLRTGDGAVALQYEPAPPETSAFAYAT